MPTGVIVNSLSVAAGGLIGAIAGSRLTNDFKDKLNMVFGCCSMAMGISSIVLMQNMPAVVFSVIIGTGIYGSMVAGMSGDNSVLFAKSILDIFTAMIFACSLGAVVCVVAIPQFLFFLFLFILGGLIIPHTTPAMIADFKACGGILMLATGFRMIRVRMFPIADMLPAMVLVMPVSALWSSLF